ncbi:hypothetical protein TanjilG_18880 [Lupinus angustifolius]|uniref:Uncharacterized protein n=1 Tax=Lupinus angustifolius TaxID=3871 RepID=A0A4P1RRL6_LUPAN|nr:hypothetical protein TanjilG_18880 [Lupinus angustifolius]
MNFDYLFGPKKSSSTLSSSSTLFGSIFPPSSYVGGRDWRKQEGKNYGASGTHSSKDESSGRISKKSTSNNYENEAVEPSYFSSSIYYGGQENYFPRSRTITEPHHVFSKKGEDDDPNGKDSSTASRGNWWEGRSNTLS